MFQGHWIQLLSFNQIMGPQAGMTQILCHFRPACYFPPWGVEKHVHDGERSRNNPAGKQVASKHCTVHQSCCPSNLNCLLSLLSPPLRGATNLQALCFQTSRLVIAVHSTSAFFEISSNRVLEFTKSHCICYLMFSTPYEINITILQGKKPKI